MASSVSIPVTQNNHGFSRGTPVRFDGTNWVLATTGAAGVGMVGAVLGPNAFEFLTLGELPGLNDLVPGSTYYPDGSGYISTTVNGTAIGVAYTATILHVNPPATTSSTSVDTTGFASLTDLATALAAEVARANAAYAALSHLHDDKYLHSIEHDGVISVTPGHSGVVFLESDGTQVLTES